MAAHGPAVDEHLAGLVHGPEMEQDPVPAEAAGREKKRLYHSRSPGIRVRDTPDRRLSGEKGTMISPSKAAGSGLPWGRMAYCQRPLRLR